MSEQGAWRRGPLTVASYNVHRCFGTDRRYMPERTIEVLHALDADIIGLQEVDMRLMVDERPQLDYIAGELGMQAIPGPGFMDHRGIFGNALLTRLPVRGVRRADLTVRRFEPRGAIEVELGGPESGIMLAAVTHLGLNAAERRLQVRRLLHMIEDGERSLPIVVMGDFNEWKPTGGAVRRLDQRFGHAVAPRTFPSRFPLLPLDRIWVWPRQGLRRIAVYQAPLARLASDHLPIRAEVAWDAADLSGVRKPGMARTEG